MVMMNEERKFDIFCGRSDSFIEHAIELETQLASMFECDNMPRDMFRQVERCFMRTGLCGYTILPNGAHYADTLSLQGKINIYGYGEDGYMIARNGLEYKHGKIGEDIILGWNSDERTPLLGLYRYADLLTEIDKSTRVNVINSRLHKIPVARSADQKKIIDKVIANLKNGKSETIINEISLVDALKDEAGVDTTIQTISLTEVHDIECVQYLSKLYDDIISRFWNEYGHNMQSTGKLAQQTTQELEGYESYAMILPYNMLACRKTWVEEINNKFGTNYKYHFSPAWTWALEQKSERYHVNGIFDLSNNDVTEEGI